MYLRLSTLAAVTGAVLLAASSIAPAQKEAYSPKASEKLSKALAGRSPGQPVSCISNLRSGAKMQVIDDYTILFREAGTVYVQKPRGGCYGLGNGSNSLVTRLNVSTRLCSGQIADLVDRVTHNTYGSCVFSEFVPYRKTG